MVQYKKCPHMDLLNDLLNDLLLLRLLEGGSIVRGDPHMVVRADHHVLAVLAAVHVSQPVARGDGLVEHALHRDLGGDLVCVHPRRAHVVQHAAVGGDLHGVEGVGGGGEAQLEVGGTSVFGQVHAVVEVPGHGVEGAGDDLAGEVRADAVPIGLLGVRGHPFGGVAAAGLVGDEVVESDVHGGGVAGDRHSHAVVAVAFIRVPGVPASVGHVDAHAACGVDQPTSRIGVDVVVRDSLGAQSGGIPGGPSVPREVREQTGLAGRHVQPLTSAIRGATTPRDAAGAHRPGLSVVLGDEHVIRRASDSGEILARIVRGHGIAKSTGESSQQCGNQKRSGEHDDQGALKAINVSKSPVLEFFSLLKILSPSVSIKHIFLPTFAFRVCILGTVQVPMVCIDMDQLYKTPKLLHGIQGIQRCLSNPT